MQPGSSVVKAMVTCCGLLFSLCAPLTAESHWRDVNGVVTDKQGNPLGKAVVQLKNDVTLSVRSYITGINGQYRFVRVRTDMDYTLRARYKRWWSRPRHASRFDSANRRGIRLVIPIQ
jgi:hypothetical protein